MKRLLLLGTAVFMLVACDDTTSAVEIPPPPGFFRKVESDTSSVEKYSSSSEVVESSSSINNSSSSVNSSSSIGENKSEYDPDQGTLKDFRDGQIYKTVVIGEGENAQTWMAENLNFRTANSSCYDDNDAMCEKYGMLYTWSDAQVACPKGWLLPSADEWRKLQFFVDENDNYSSVTSLLSKTDWDIPGTDDCGFNVLPGGRYWRNTNVEPFKYVDKGVLAEFWTSSILKDGGAYIDGESVDYDWPEVMVIHSSDKGEYFASGSWMNILDKMTSATIVTEDVFKNSVRCIKE